MDSSLATTTNTPPNGTLAVATGTQVYATAVGRVVVRGVSWSAAELDAALSGQVASLLRDDLGREGVRSLLSGLADTEFSSQRVQEILDEPRSSLDAWRVGEALAEAVLVSHRECFFPWPVRRDVRNPNASPAGCDLVGFHGDGEATRLAFGEVKTSEQQEWPPSVMHGRHGLAKQLEDLRDNKALKNWLLLYLGYRAKDSSWEARFRAAGRRFLSDADDVVLFGVLVRDVVPKDEDLTGRAAALATGQPQTTSIELHALYLSAGSITQLASRAQAALGGTT